MIFEETNTPNPEDVARRYACRPGFRLADYAEVGLPVYRLTVQAYFLARKQIPPVEEFVLKAIEAGLNSSDEIGGFLGLEQLLVGDALASLVQTDDVSLTAPAGAQTQVLALTQKGEHTLREAKLLVPEERTITVDFDGLLRKPIAYAGWLLKPRELRDAGVKEIPPFPQKRPEATDLKVKEVGRALRQPGNPVELSRELLGIKAIERRELFFQPALALVYKAKVGEDIQVAFAVDGRISTEHEGAFAGANGPKKLGILQALTASKPVWSEADATPPNAVDQLSEQKIDELKKASAAAQAELTEASLLCQQADSEEEKNRAEEKAEVAAKRLTEASSALAAIPVRGLDVHEHPPLLAQAMAESKERLLIISPWIRSMVVNKAFVSQLTNLLRRNVRVWIGYGLGEEDDKMSGSDRRAEQDLVNLAGRHPNFTFVRLGDTHAKIIVSDRRFMVTTSFNWLSFRGDPNRTFRDEQGIYVAVPDFIDERFKHLVSRFPPQSDGK